MKKNSFMTGTSPGSKAKWYELWSPGANIVIADKSSAQVVVHIGRWQYDISKLCHIPWCALIHQKESEYFWGFKILRFALFAFKSF